MSRDEFSVKTKRAAYDRSGGICECGCGQPFTDHPKERPHFDHILPDFLGGENDLENCQVIRVCCHAVKTGLDIKHITKARRGERDRRNIKPRKSRPLPGSKGSGLRKRMNGDVIRVKE